MTKPKVTCCKIWKAPYPSGHQWTHSKDCRMFPNRKVNAKRQVPPKVKAILDHPSLPIDGGWRAVAVWLEHEDGCPDIPAPGLCPPCANVNFWLDRDDDWEAVDA